MIDLQLLGGLDFVGPDPSVSARSRRRHPMMLLALVAAAAPKAIGREKIMAFLWPESDSERASNSLRQALHCLRRELDEDLFLPESASGIRLDRTKVSVDLWVFREAIARHAPGDAVAVYRGPFLDGFQMAGVPEFSRWMDAERERVEREHGAALDTLARQAEAAQRYDEAVVLRRRQAAADPFSSRVAIGLLKSLAAAGDRAGALEYAAVYEGLVRTHLEVGTDPAVAEFVASLRRLPAKESRPRSDHRSMEEAAPAQGAATPETAAASPVASPVTAMSATSPALTAPRRRRNVGWSRWLVATGVIGLVVVGAAVAMIAAKPPTETVIVLATGASPAAGRDATNRLVACEGPACPSGALPQDAYVVPTHIAHTKPATGTRFIAPTARGTTVPAPGYRCCSTAVFENEFTLPPNAGSATISITLLADNQAIVAINGVEFGRQVERLAPWNHGGPPATFATAFSPDPSGVNRLRVTLWDGGGAAALNYRAFVMHDKGWETDSGGN